MLWVLKRTVILRLEHPKHMFKFMDKKIFTILRSTNLIILTISFRGLLNAEHQSVHYVTVLNSPESDSKIGN